MCLQLGRERLFNIAFCGCTFTHLSLSLCHVISHGVLVGSHASTPLKLLLSHILRDVTDLTNALQTLLRVVSIKEEMLIEKVRQRIILYDTKSSDYRDQYLRDNASEEIGKELKIQRKFYVCTCMCIFISGFIYNTVFKLI
jgi:hypothetical protein